MSDITSLFPSTTMRPIRSTNRQHGFTLVELICTLIIIGVLAAIAVPKFISMNTDACLASLKTLAAAIQTASENVHALCRLAVGCTYTDYSVITIGGKSAALDLGWPDAGDNLNLNEIDIWVNYSGFTPTLSGNNTTYFNLNGSPDPTNCSVKFRESPGTGVAPAITLLTTGC